MIGRQSREVEAMQPGRKGTDPVLGRIRLADGLVDQLGKSFVKPRRPSTTGTPRDAGYGSCHEHSRA
jgi:hypothetical protein